MLKKHKETSFGKVATKSFILTLTFWLTLLFGRKMRFQAVFGLSIFGTIVIYFLSKVLFENDATISSVLGGIGYGLIPVQIFSLLMLLLNKK